MNRNRIENCPNWAQTKVWPIGLLDFSLHCKPGFFLTADQSVFQRYFGGGLMLDTTRIEWEKEAET